MVDIKDIRPVVFPGMIQGDIALVEQNPLDAAVFQEERYTNSSGDGNVITGDNFHRLRARELLGIW